MQLLEQDLHVLRSDHSQAAVQQSDSSIHLLSGAAGQLGLDKLRQIRPLLRKVNLSNVCQSVGYSSPDLQLGVRQAHRQEQPQSASGVITDHYFVIRLVCSPVSPDELLQNDRGHQPLFQSLVRG